MSSSRAGLSGPQVRRAIRNVSAVVSSGVLPEGTIAIEGSRIVSVGQGPFSSDEDIDGRGLLALPGFIDVHVQGGDGASTMDADPDALEVISRAHARFGTTGFLATSTPNPRTENANLRAVAQAIRRGVSGARPLGVHLEGPFINPRRRGGFGEEHVRPPSLSAFEAYQAASGGYIRMVTLAPEVEGAEALIRHLTAQGIVVSAGHTEATYEEMMRAIEVGVSHVTHMYNAMTPFGHRSPGVVGAALLSPEVTLQLIADGVHLHPAAVRLAVEQAGVDRIALITDAVGPLGLPEGRYASFGHEVLVRDGRVQLADGTLAGSVLTMNRAVKNVMEFAGVPIWEAARMAAAVPARVLGQGDHKGALEPGKDADLVLVDEDLKVHLTMVEGRVVFEG